MTAPSITTWIAQVKSGESTAAQHLWERYLSALVHVARKRLAGSPQRVADADDVVVVAFEKFLRYAQQGRFPRLDDRYDLWQVLLMVTEQVACDQRRTLAADKRGGAITHSFGSARGVHRDDSGSQWQPASADPSPEFAAATTEQCRRLMGLLDDELRQIAVGKIYGLTNEEVARQQKVSTRGVERKLSIIRKIWSRELDA
jgi:RNA polymerase sigma factor (sigma-70 family)